MTNTIFQCKIRENFATHDYHADGADEHRDDQQRVHGGRIFNRPLNDRLHSDLESEGKWIECLIWSITANGAINRFRQFRQR